jgi:hypothetical protein
MNHFMNKQLQKWPVKNIAVTYALQCDYKETLKWFLLSSTAQGFSEQYKSSGFIM